MELSMPMNWNIFKFIEKEMTDLLTNVLIKKLSVEHLVIF